MASTEKEPKKENTKLARYQKGDRKKTAMIIALGAAFMIGGHFVFWEMGKAIDRINQEKIKTEHSSSLENLMPMALDIGSYKSQQDILVQEITKVWGDWSSLDQVPKVPISKHSAKKKIVIIIDDMGVNRKLSMRTLDLPAPLTLAFLPYAKGLKSITRKAKEKGHELMIHMPMEPMNDKLDVGSIALLDNMNPEEISNALERAFNAFDGYVGVNNHMGSRVTQNKKIMNQVMGRLAERNLLFVDSKTINSSIAGKTAAQFGLNYAERDIFLDHEEGDQFVRDSLKRLEVIARKRGYAIAIGHPKTATIKGLKKWIPTLEARGFEIVPISAVVRKDPNFKLSKIKKPPSSVQPELPSLPHK